MKHKFEIIAYPTKESLSPYFNHFLDIFNNITSECFEFEIKNSNSELCKNLDNYSVDKDLSKVFRKYLSSNFVKLFIITDRSSPFCQWVKIQNPKALWGGSIDLIAVDYSPVGVKSFSVVHELLHLFGIDDCSLDNRKPRKGCNEPQCIMRYGNTSGYQVCDEVKKEINKYIENIMS